MLPGFIDAHAHLAMLGELLLSLDLSKARTFDEIVARVAAQAPRDEWVVGRGWDLPEFPSHERLRQDVPVWLWRKDAHSGLANAKALALAGIREGTPDPPGGRIDARTGMLYETATELVERVAPPLDARTCVRRAEEEALRLGVTCVHDACVTDAGTLDGLRLRVHPMLWRPDQRPIPGARAMKLFMDGSLGSGTAWMLDGRGVARLAAADVRACVESGAQVCVHAIGTRAVREALEGLAGAEGRHRIEHAQHIDLDDIPRFRGVIASMQPSHGIADERMMRERLSERERRGSYAFRALLEAGARLAFGSDAPVETIDPRWTYECARRQGLTDDETLRAMTTDAAYAAFMERDVGMIRPGMRADFAVCAGEWPSEVVMTIVDGQVVAG